MNLKTAMMALALCLAVSASSQATVLVGGTVFGLKDSLGATPASSVKTIAIVDRDGDGLAGFDLGNWDGSSFLPDADDWIVTDTVGANGSWNEATGDGAVVGSGIEAFGNDVLEVLTNKYQFGLEEGPDSAGQKVAGVNANDKVYLFWFPDLALGAMAPGVGQSYGVLELGALDATGGVNYVGDFGDVHVASNVTTPEPASLMAILLGGVAICGKRRRRSA
jgi:hypothetical protein